MRSPLKTKLLKYGISCGICLALTAAYALLRIDITDPGQLPLAEIFLILCDAFSIPGLLFLMFGCFISLSNEGAMDGLGYVVVTGFRMLIPGGGVKMERYKEYLERRRSNRLKGYGFLYVVGAFWMGIALIFMAAFYWVRA